jgi:hypothetical protein
VITLKFCALEFTPDGAVTRFPDGTEIGAHPHANAHYHVIAHRLGYGDDILRFCQEHEFAHSFVAERLLDRPSVVLSALAHGTQFSGRNAAFEELTAQAFQRWLRANERPIISGVKWDEMKADALELLGGGEHVGTSSRHR